MPFRTAHTWNYKKDMASCTFGNTRAHHLQTRSSIVCFWSLHLEGGKYDRSECINCDNSTSVAVTSPGAIGSSKTSATGRAPARQNRWKDFVVERVTLHKQPRSEVLFVQELGVHIAERRLQDVTKVDGIFAQHLHDQFFGSLFLLRLGWWRDRSSACSRG